MKKLLVVLCALLTTASLSAQRTISGTVTDENSEPLIGANVVVKGTTNGEITDLDGRYTITVPEGYNILTISYIGYTTQEVEIGTQSQIDILLVEGQLIGEVVITGYGVQDKKSITGSVSTVSAEDIEALPIASIDQILQGQAPGLNILSGSGQPGSNTVSVVLRGPSSIQGNNNPIYVMDGVQIRPADFAALNPNDIESISILKDASSTAIYGASGANGVILINTKSGFNGETRVSYNVQYGSTTRARDQFDMMNSTEKLAFEALARRGPGWNLSPDNPNNSGLSEEELAANAAELDRLRGINTNWRDIVFRSGRIMSHNVSVMGGDDKTRFYIAGNYYEEEGVLNGSDFNRGTLRANFSEQVSDIIKVGIRASGGFGKSNLVQSENAINLNNPAALAYLANPYEEVRDADGNFVFGATGRNPIEEVEFNYEEQNNLKLLGQAYVEVSPIEQLTFTGRWGVDYTNVSSKSYIDPNSRLSTTVQGGQGQLDKEVDNTIWTTFSHLANYTNVFNERHNLNVLIGQETRKRTRDDYSFNSFGLTGGLETPAAATAGSADNPDFIPIIAGLEREKVLNSFFSRLNYTLDDKYNLTAGIRRDGNSVFGENNRWGTFWNLGASWIISRESFLENNSILNYLKLGVSYGTNGNSEGILEQEQYTLYANSSYAGNPAFVPSATNPGNPDLKWEVLKGINAFVEFGLFDDFLFGNVAYYRNNTEDLFISQELPRSGGGTSLTINAGSMRNQGVEVELNAALLKGDPYLEVGVQFAYNQNVITDLGQVDEFEQGTSIIREGLSLGTHYIEEWGGVDPATGNPLYIDADGNVTDNFAAVEPKAIFGSNFSPWTGGLTLTAGYKGFTLNVLGNWVYGNTLFNNQTFFQENPNFAQFNLSTIMNGVWQNPGDVTDVQRIGTARQFSSKDLEDGSFFRMRRVTLGYAIPLQNDLLGVFSGIRLFVQGRNLFTITNFSGFDPEDNNNIATYGFPSARAITVGANVDF
ncbi:MAG: TonB-dependent receptor [Bacteroidota bacterium]